MCGKQRSYGRNPGSVARKELSTFSDLAEDGDVDEGIALDGDEVDPSRLRVNKMPLTEVNRRYEMAR